MKVKDVLTELWSPTVPLNNTPYPLDMCEPHYVNMLRRFSEVSTARSITHGEAAMLIAAMPEVCGTLFDYKEENTPLPESTFYRGVEHESYDDKHIMALQS